MTTYGQDGQDPDFKRGVELLQGGDLASAKAHYHKMLESKPDSDAVLTTLAAIAVEEGRMSDAVEYCSRVLSAIHDHPIAREILAEANVRMAEAWAPGEAIGPLATAAEDAITLVPGNPDYLERATRVLSGFADHLKTTGKPEEALVYEAKVAQLRGQAA